MLQSVPFTVGTEGRLYTSYEQRKRVDCDGLCGETRLSVGVTTVDRSVDWNGSYGQSATFTARLGVDGEVRIPIEVRRRLDIEHGDVVRVTLK